MSIDLSVSWTNTSVTIKQLGDDGKPPLNYVSFWPDDSGSSVHAFGGERSFALDSNVSAPQSWQFTPDGLGGGSWNSQASSSAFSSLVQPAGGLQTFGHGVGLYLGGHLSSRTYPQSTISYFQPVPGLIMFNMTSNSWQNITAVGYNQNQTAHQGTAQFVPGIGANGVFIFLGGQTSSPTDWTEFEPLVSMNDLVVFDPSSQKWYHQQATGDIPEPRIRACVVGAQGDNGTYEM